MDEYGGYDAVGLAELVRNGEVTPAELADAAIARIERHNRAINAVVYEAYDEARAAAAGRLPEGPFRGVPFLIKDLGAPVAGWPQTQGSRFMAAHVDAVDCSLVARYRAAGLVLVGKTNTPEFGITGTTEGALLGACRNPWNPDHITGGSSGGSAAATAAGVVPMAHANDGTGSIRIPAACCGLVGLKTTRDRIPNLPEADYADGTPVEHVVSRTVRDTAAMLDVTGLPEPASPYASPPRPRSYLDECGRAPGRLRIAFPAEPPARRPVDPEVQTALEATAALLKGLGHEVIDRPLSINYRALWGAWDPVSAGTFAANMRRRIAKVGREPEPDELEPLTWFDLEASRRVRGESVMWGLQELRLLNRQTLANFEDIDAYLSPVMTAPPPTLGYISPLDVAPHEHGRRSGLLYPYTPFANFSGQPSMSLPLAQSKAGLPIGMMFTGKYGDEATLIRLAAQLEKEAPWKDRRPPIWN
jgi:amidase